MKGTAMKMKKTGMSVIVAAAMLAAGSTAMAEPEGWGFEIMPYVWFAGIEGDMTVNGRDIDFDRDAEDLFDAVEVGGSLLGVVQYNRFLFWGQVDYFELSTDELNVEDRPQGGRLDSDMLLVEAAVGYQVDGFAEGQTFDLLVGVRHLDIENDLEVFGVGRASRDSDATDPIFVVRPSIPLFPSKIKGLRFNPTLAIGGGGDSELVWELFPQIQYHFTPNIAMRLGYRTVGYEFDGDGNDNELDFRLAGLIFGLGGTF